MSFLIAAAGTGGHVFPGLAVAEALVDLGTGREDITFVGGDRLESRVYPDAGYDFVQLELRGLKRSASLSNLTLPRVVFRARDRIGEEIRRRNVQVLLGMGGYVTIPGALAARKRNISLMVSEQNAHAGLANRIASRWASRAFVSFPKTIGIDSGEWVGNPVRSAIARFDRSSLRPLALERYGLDEHLPTVGVFGGSLGAASINLAVSRFIADWTGPPIQVLHLVGASHEGKFDEYPNPADLTWVRVGFEAEMDQFFAAVDLVIARAGGAVAEITATATPAILIPGDFGSAGHQSANASYLAAEGAVKVLAQEDLSQLGPVVAATIFDGEALRAMAGASRRVARPDAAKAIARAMIEATS